MFNKQKYIFECLKREFYSDYINNVVTFKGKAGVGKTYVVDKLIHECQNNDDMTICYISGDQFCQEREYYCIKQSLSEVSVEYEKKKHDTNLIAEFVGELPQLGDISKKIVSDKLNYSNINQNRKTFFLNNDDEKNIVYRLNYLLGKKHSLIICDNFQFFDKKSLEIIYLFLKNSSQFEFMKQCQFLIVVTTEQFYEPIVDNIINQFSKKEFELEPITFEEMDAYLDNFALEHCININIKKVLFNLANGHLEVIKQIALKMDNQFSANNASAHNLEEFLECLITKNLEKLGEKGNEISHLLEYASLIGKKFLNYEVERTSSLHKQDYINIMRYSENMDYIIQGKPYTYFSHDIIQLIFRNKAYRNNIQYYERMQECVKELFPGDYIRRIQIEIQLDNMYNAAILIVLLYFKYNFKNIYEKDEYSSIIKEFSDVNEFYYYFKTAIEEYHKRNYKETIKKLNRISDIYPTQLLVIRDILKSISLTKLINNNYRKEAIKCLDNYTLENMCGEGDLYLQVLLARISSYSHNGMIKQAKNCEKQLYQYLQPRISYDENAKTTLYIIKRKSNCMHECIIAERQIKESVDYFKPLPGNTAALNPIQYLMSLANHSGILIECGRFCEALKEVEKAYDFIKINPMTVFPRLQIVDNNFLIALYLEKHTLKKDVLNSYKKLVNLSENADNIFIISNYCSFLAINGEIENAYALLLKSRNQALNNSETFYEISVENNILILELYKKNYIEAQSILNRLVETTNGIIDESYYKKKYELLQLAIDQQIDITIDNIDTFLFEYCSHYQEAWSYWGHSFDFTALYYWSDL